MHRFFLSSPELDAEEVTFSADHSRQITRVLRMKPGDHCIVLDNLGGEMVVELTIMDGDKSTGFIIERRPAEEPKTKLLMLLCLTQREKFEWMLQKCTEIGAAAFIPVISSRSLVQSKAGAESKYERWRMIIREAAEQSGRGRLPELLPPTRLAEAAGNAARHYQLCLIPWEGEVKRSLKDAVRNNAPDSAAVLIGPEGGFAEDEMQQAMNAGFIPVTLGRRILRMETAALVAAALVLHELE